MSSIVIFKRCVKILYFNDMNTLKLARCYQIREKIWAQKIEYNEFLSCEQGYMSLIYSKGYKKNAGKFILGSLYMNRDP
jgi:hypothetical protein